MQVVVASWAGIQSHCVLTPSFVVGAVDAMNIARGGAHACLVVVLIFVSTRVIQSKHHRCSIGAQRPLLPSANVIKDPSPALLI